MGELPSRFAEDEPVDDPAGEVDEAQIRGEEDEEGEEVAGNVASEHDDSQELLDRCEDGAAGHECDERLHGCAPARDGAVTPGVWSRAWPQRWAAARWPDSGAVRRQHCGDR